MTFVDIGNGAGWKIDSDEIDKGAEVLNQLDILAGKTLALLEELTANYTNLGETEALRSLQSCVHEIFRRADQCCQESKRYEISDNENSDLH